MGVIQSSEARAKRFQHLEAERELRRGKLGKQVKLLLLGSAECGKSTILKQMRILHDNGFSEAEIVKNRSVVYLNMIDAMRTMLFVMEQRNMAVPENVKQAEGVIKQYGRLREVTLDAISAELVDAIRKLWSTEVVQYIYDKREEYHLSDCAKYFLDDIDRICAKGYIPTSQDMLMLRVETNGIVEVSFTIKNLLFRMFDVGGQRSERKKWIHCFDDVTTIIYVAALSDFDMMLKEDSTTNRLNESIQLFRQVVNNGNFAQIVSFILFLNKKDIFAEKLKSKSIKIALPEYTGSGSYSESVAYIAKEYSNKLMDKSKELYIHETCATDTNQVELVLSNVIDMVMEINLKTGGFQ